MVQGLDSSHSRDQARLAAQLGAAASRHRVQSELQAADSAVKAHEQTHIAIAGPYAKGGPQLIYAVGPDGSRYAVGGSVRVDTQPVPGNPEATLRKAVALMQAATGVGQPSAADMRVAAEAYRMAMQARREIQLEWQSGESQGPGQLVNLVA